MTDNLSLFDLSQFEKKQEKPKLKKIDRQNIGFDFIYTDSTSRGLCCMACSAGLKYGIQSGYGSICPNHTQKWHKLTFLDLDFKNYNHERHIEAVKQYKPKYSIVRDIMTKEQCQELDMQWYSEEQILKWAEEIDQYAENTVIVPKYPEVFERIPDKFVLGYTTGGGYSKSNPLAPELYIGRQVHILGASWKRQLKMIVDFTDLGINVVSCDNNNLNKVAIYGTYSLPDGSSGKVKKDLKLNELTNHWHVAATISFGSIAYKINEMFGGNKE